MLRHVEGLHDPRYQEGARASARSDSSCHNLSGLRRMATHSQAVSSLYRSQACQVSCRLDKGAAVDDHGLTEHDEAAMREVQRVHRPIDKMRDLEPVGRDQPPGIVVGIE